MKYRIVLIIEIVTLLIAYSIWNDELNSKLNLFYGNNYEYIKIVLHSLVAYRLAKWAIPKFSKYTGSKKWNKFQVFLILFTIFNSYIITQYSFRMISNRIVNYDVRNSLNSKIRDTKSWGWGYEGSDLTTTEFKELNKQNYFPEIPVTSTSIMVHRQFGMQDHDFKVGFKVPIEFNPNTYFRQDTNVLNNLVEIKPHPSFIPKALDTTMNVSFLLPGSDIHDYINVAIFDTSEYKYYLWISWEI